MKKPSHVYISAHDGNDLKSLSWSEAMRVGSRTILRASREYTMLFRLTPDEEGGVVVENTTGGKLDGGR